MDQLDRHDKLPKWTMKFQAFSEGPRGTGLEAWMIGETFKASKTPNQTLWPPMGETPTRFVALLRKDLTGMHKVQNVISSGMLKLTEQVYFL